MVAGVGLSSVAVLTNTKVNGILGLLCREHFPGLVHYQGRYEPAWTWDHYIAANNDQLDRSGRAFENKAERVKGELWVSFFHQKMVNTSHSFNIFSMMT